MSSGRAARTRYFMLINAQDGARSAPSGHLNAGLPARLITYTSRENQRKKSQFGKKSANQQKKIPVWEKIREPAEKC
jgi:hypothetical protein